MELIIQAFIFMVTFVLLFRRDRFCALFYFILYLYMLPDEVCCGYFPFLLQMGEVGRIYVPFYIYSSLSIFLFWFVLYKCAGRGRTITCIYGSTNYQSRYMNRNAIRVRMVYMLIFLTLLSQMIFMYACFEDISYHHLASVEYKSSHPLLDTASTLHDISYPMIFLLLFKVRLFKKKKRIFCIFLLLWALVQNTYFGILAGSRSSLLAILMGVLFIFYGNKKVSIGLLVKILIVGATTAFVFSNIRFTRSGGAEDDSAKEYVLLQQDYIGPEINTIAAFKYDVIIPVELISSNFMKIFPFNDYPYLYITMADIFAPGTSDANAGYGFYLFTEGYLFAGKLGFLYNGIFLAFLLFIWRRLGRTNDPNFNTFIMAVMISFFFAMVRSQSSSFFRNMWSQLLPMAFLYSWFMGVGVNYKRLFLNMK